MGSVKYITPLDNVRIDLLSRKAYGDPYKYAQLLRDNPTLNLWNIKPTQRVKVTNAG